MPELSHPKIEHAVLWSIVKQEYGERCIDAQSVSAELLAIAPPSQVQAAIDHLLECGYLTDRSAVMQPHYEPTRKAYLKIEQLIAVKTSFVGRLHMHGPKFLNYPAAHEAKLESRLESDSKQPAKSAEPAGPAVTINNNVSPVQHNSSPPPASNPFAQSSARAGWTNVWLSVLALIVAVAGLLYAFGAFG